MKNENIQPLLLEAMESAGYVKDGKPRLNEFADYIGVAPKTVTGWKKSISVIATFAFLVHPLFGLVTVIVYLLLQIKR